MPQGSLAQAALLSSLAVLVLTGCHSGEPDPRTGAQLVRVATAGGAADDARRFTGIVSARVQSDLGFRVPGKITQRLVDTGQVVRRGQPLMRIDRTDLALATNAQAGVVAAARARAVQTSSDERRYRALVTGGAVSASSYDQAKAAADAARAQLDAALAQAGVARNEAGYSVLYADADGVVVETEAEPGQVVAAGQTVVRLAHAGPREALVALPETIRPPIGSTAVATTFGSGASVAARLRQLSDAADPQTRTFEARYVLLGAAARAPLGATVTVAIATAAGAAPAVRVPLAAIHDAGKGPGLWLVRGKPMTVTWRPVRVASVDEESAMVSGLARGQRFVALGAHLLHEGEPVRVAAPPAAEGAR